MEVAPQDTNIDNTKQAIIKGLPRNEYLRQYNEKRRNGTLEKKVAIPRDQYMRDYMKMYHLKGQEVHCDICDKVVMKVRHYRHKQGKTHKMLELASKK